MVVLIPMNTRLLCSINRTYHMNASISPRQTQGEEGGIRRRCRRCRIPSTPAPVRYQYFLRSRYRACSVIAQPPSRGTAYSGIGVTTTSHVCHERRNATTSSRLACIALECCFPSIVLIDARGARAGWVDCLGGGGYACYSHGPLTSQPYNARMDRFSDLRLPEMHRLINMIPAATTASTLALPSQA